jgi:AbiTii
MKSVDDLIEMAADSKRPLGDALRKCLIQSFDLKNDKLKDWVKKELNGYCGNDEIPDYRKAMLHSRGNFSGPAGSWIPKRPLPIGVIDKKHRYMLVSNLRAPIASYEGLWGEGRRGNYKLAAGFDCPLSSEIY